MILVQIFLRGGCDGLSLVAPIAGPDRKHYEEERPNLKLAISGDKKALSLSETLGLHPAAKELHELYADKKLAVVQATGLMRPTRSHFDAQMLIETGGDEDKGARDGWLGRFVQSEKAQLKAVMGALALGSQLPSSYLAFDHALVINSLGGFNIDGGKFQEAQRASLRRMYASSSSSWMSHSAESTLDAIDELENIKPGDYKPAAGIEYPNADIGHKLKLLAQLLKLGLGTEVVTVDMGGWDTHKNQGANGEGPFANMVGQLSQAISAFYKDVQGSQKESIGSKVRIVVMSEFGRRLKENGNGGTDHGHGSFMLAIGDAIHGGRVYGTWPGLATEQLFERADFKVTTDYRQVLSEIVFGKDAAARSGQLFPGFIAAHLLGIA